MTKRGPEEDGTVHPLMKVINGLSLPMSVSTLDRIMTAGLQEDLTDQMYTGKTQQQRNLHVFMLGTHNVNMKPSV